MRDIGFEAERSWGSDGRSLSMPPDIDIKAVRDDLELHIQVKRRKKIANYLDFKNANMVAVRQDRGPWVFIIDENTMRDVFRI